MNWLRNLVNWGQRKPAGDLQSLRDNFNNFLALLEKNQELLKIITDLEEKSQGECLFDTAYLQQSLARIRVGTAELVERMIALGGDQYAPLRERAAAINNEIGVLLAGEARIEKDFLTIPLSRLDAERAGSVGHKSANLGEIKHKLGLPVPEGFALSAWADQRFMAENDLPARIRERLSGLDLKNYDDLRRVSAEIQALVISIPIPLDLARAIEQSVLDLALPPETRYALRSSALGEDAGLSFAGQYATFLDVPGARLAERYRDLLASKFSPKAIYYFLNHAVAESQLAMGACCVAMVDAAASGVVYTRDPVRPEAETLIVSSIFGLGPYLVNGTLTPDVFRISRADLTVVAASLANKPVRLVLTPAGGVGEAAVPEAAQNLASLTEEELRQLAEYALQIEAHFGGPQDIEWARDRAGRLFILQARPLRMLCASPLAAAPLSLPAALRTGGTMVCPGAGAGPVYAAATAGELARVPAGAVLVARHPLPGLVTVMDRLSALVTEVGGVASHMATLAREQRLPTLVGVERAGELPAGEVVTVDATAGAIYAGRLPELIEARRPAPELFADTAIFGLLRKILTRVAPLNLRHPADANFRPEHCRTIHDLTRFAHQKAMEEMFRGATTLEPKDRQGLRLKSEIPLAVHIVYLDGEPGKTDAEVKEDEISSAPMRHFWQGVKAAGWPQSLPRVDVKGFVAVLATNAAAGSRREFSETSYALLSREYMLLSLRMGYHFSTIEAMCGAEPGNNYIRIQYKEGGAAFDRRVRRIKLITDLLAAMGFETSSQGDFLDATLSYAGAEAMAAKLELLGRISIMTKQLDMALSNDAIAQWYTEDFLKKLGLSAPREAGP